MQPQSHSRLALDADPVMTETALRQQLDEMNDLLALVAHELRNPLHALSLQMSVARLTAESHQQADTTARLAKAQKTLERYTDRVTVLLDLVSRRGPDYPVNPKTVDVDAVLAGLAEGLGAEAAYFHTRIVYQSQGACTGELDPLLLEQIVENLMLNAFKHASSTLVEVKLTHDGSWVNLDITDNGRGIAQDDQDRIFRKFEVSRQSERGSGSGLGLWIVRRLVQVLGGDISLRSAPGAGCTFTVRFPLSSPSVQSTTSP